MTRWGGQIADAIADLPANAEAVWQWLQVDSSEASLTKIGILILFVGFLLWVLADVYRGEIQNQDFAVDVTTHGNKYGYGDKDVVFTQATLDIRSERLPANMVFFHSFTIVDGERSVQRRVKVRRRPVRLRMVRTSHRVEHQHIALSPSLEIDVKNRAELLQRRSLAQYCNNPLRRLQRGAAQSKDAVRVDVHSPYVIRVHFSANPWFLLFLHPDRDVKATGWLTLLTSMFAVLAEFLF